MLFIVVYDDYLDHYNFGRATSGVKAEDLVFIQHHFHTTELKNIQKCANKADISPAFSAGIWPELLLFER